MAAYVEKHEPERTSSFRTKFYDNMTPPNKKIVIASIFICKFKKKDIQK